MTSTTAKVEVLAARVTCLMVGSRQVTMSVYRQLDQCPPEAIEPFGRVRDSKDEIDEDFAIYVIGSERHTGNLVRSWTSAPDPWDSPFDNFTGEKWWGRAAAANGWAVDSPRGRGAKAWVCIETGEPRMPRRALSLYPFRAKPDTFAPEFVRPNSPEVEAQVRQWVRDDAVEQADRADRWKLWSALPLVVLAGLR